MSGKKTIVVTGASRGIGAVIALELARRGFTVGCLTRKGAGPETAVPAELAPRLVNTKCDVTDEASVKHALATVAAKTGAIHGIVNNAGIHLDAPSDKLTLDVYNQVMSTNATAVFTACREVYPHLVKAGGGIIVNIGSYFDKIGVKRNVAYCTSKAAVGAITRCLAVEWASKNIRVLDVAPGYIETDLNREAFKGPLREFLAKRIPGNKPGTPEDIAKLTAAIFCEDLSFLTGETLYIDGAQGIAH
ncbi:MAG: SDR family oxidoreductase [Betaproteobacteria bacterium]|nr:SDR family oxidoreductase [Betaproteobacteria bacterium]